VLIAAEVRLLDYGMARKRNGRTSPFRPKSAPAKNKQKKTGIWLALPMRVVTFTPSSFLRHRWNYIGSHRPDSPGCEKALDSP
jgi:hypothetical protein